MRETVHWAAQCSSSNCQSPTVTLHIKQIFDHQQAAVLVASANSTGNADSNRDAKNSRELRINNQTASAVCVGNRAVSAVSEQLSRSCFMHDGDGQTVQHHIWIFLKIDFTCILVTCCVVGRTCYCHVGKIRYICMAVRHLVGRSRGISKLILFFLTYQ